MAAKNIILYSVVIESNQNIIDSQSLPSSFQGAGTDEEALIDILCTRTNQVCDDKVTCALLYSNYGNVAQRIHGGKVP